MRTVRGAWCAVGLVVALVAPASAATNAANKGTIRVANNYQTGTNATEQAAVARTHDLVVMGTGYTTYGPPDVYYQTNPAILAVGYQSWFDTGNGSPDWATINTHEDWFYHDANGVRITTYSTATQSGCNAAQCPTNPGMCNCRFGMNLGNAGYQQFVASRLTDMVTAGGTLAQSRAFDGVFLDNTFASWPYRSSKVSSGWVSATPVIGGVTQTEAQWDADQLAFIKSMKSAVGTGKLLLFNGCQANSSSPLWAQNSYGMLQYADGCTMEDWVVSGSDTAGVAKTGTAFQQDLDLFAGVTSRDKWSLPLVGSGIHSPAVNRYGIVASLLIWSGPKTAMDFWKGTGTAAINGTFATTFPEASVDLGTPSEAYQKLANGVLSRKYSAGRVVLNPTTTTQTVALDYAMSTIEGASLTSVTLPPATAEILLGAPPNPTNAPPATPANNRRTDVH